MQFYWSWKRLPEFQHRSGKEYRQALWQVGLKPFRHWQVWVALLITSALMLFWLESLLGVTDRIGLNNGLRIALLLLCAILVIVMSRLLFRHFYLGILRSYIPRVSFDPDGSWWSAYARSSLLGCVSFTLILLTMFCIDWGINYYDEDLDPRFASIKAWPEPIPEDENGFIASVGLQVSADASPFEIGRAFISAYNEATLNRTEVPNAPSELKYVEFVENPKARSSSISQGRKTKNGKAKTRSVFCAADKESCWNVLRQEPQEVAAWVAANKVLLARYESLKKYPRWQHAMLINYSSPYVSYARLIHGQALLQATAMREIENGRVGHGLQMISDDIIFVRRMLAEKDVLIGKMIATVMLTKDLALLSETLQTFPHVAQQYLREVEKMVVPLTAGEVSVMDAMTFENKYQLAVLESDAPENYSLFSNSDTSDRKPFHIVDIWIRHHFKRNASINLAINNFERQKIGLEVRDVNATRPDFNAESYDKALGDYNWHFNQIGEILYRVGLVSYNQYANRLFDLNALNNLVRLQLKLTAQRVPASDVPAFLMASDRSLWNPETTQPFEWDGRRRQIYFVAATDFFNNKEMIGGVPGRVGVQMNLE